MNHRRLQIPKTALAASILLVMAAGTAPAQAEGVTKAQCVSANGNAQELRRNHKLAAARAQLHICGDPVCPAIVRDDCTRRLDEVESAQPTILFDAKDGSGHDLTVVSVTVDGQPLTEKLDGVPLSIDPGEHVFTFTNAGQPTVTQTFVLSEGEKGRRERILLGPPAPTPAPGTALPGAGTSPETPAAGSSTLRTAGFITGGVGVAGIVVGTIFGLSAISKNSASNANNNCDPGGCDSAGTSLRNTALRDARVSTISFVAGGVLAAAGVVLVLVAPSKKHSTVGKVDLTPMAGPGSTGFMLRGAW